VAEPGRPARWEVPAALDGERVDRVLALITGLSRREVNDVVDGGRVRVGRRVVTSRSRKVRAGEALTVDGPLEAAGPILPVADAGVGFDVVYEDEAVIVVDKPAGLVVHPGAGNKAGTLVHGLLALYPELGDLAESGAEERPGIVHRLDKGTSGLMVVARTAGALADLREQLATHEMARVYTTLVLGSVESDEGLIDAPLGRGDRDPTRVTVLAGGRPARTRYEVEARFDEPAPATLLTCRLETGRTHQVRVHLAAIGHPVIGDGRYGRGRSTTVGSWRPLPADRPFLHARALGLRHPVTGAAMRWESPLPADLVAVLGRFA
jgi:23S rRNA pseudouridine1911/1915/1917 synthase